MLRRLHLAALAAILTIPTAILLGAFTQSAGAERAKTATKGQSQTSRSPLKHKLWRADIKVTSGAKKVKVLRDGFIQITFKESLGGPVAVSFVSYDHAGSRRTYEVVAKPIGRSNVARALIPSRFRNFDGATRSRDIMVKSSEGLTAKLRVRFNPFVNIGRDIPAFVSILVTNATITDPGTIPDDQDADLAVSMGGRTTVSKELIFVRRVDTLGLIHEATPSSGMSVDWHCASGQIPSNKLSGLSGKDLRATTTYGTVTAVSDDVRVD